LRWSPSLTRVKTHDARYAAYGALTRAVRTHPPTMCEKNLVAGNT